MAITHIPERHAMSTKEMLRNTTIISAY